MNPYGEVLRDRLKAFCEKTGWHVSDVAAMLGRERRALYVLTRTGSTAPTLLRQLEQWLDFHEPLACQTPQPLLHSLAEVQALRPAPEAAAPTPSLAAKPSPAAAVNLAERDLWHEVCELALHAHDAQRERVAMLEADLAALEAREAAAQRERQRIAAAIDKLASEMREPVEG